MTHDETNQNEKPETAETCQPKMKEQPPKKLRKPPELLAKTLLDAIEFRPSILGVGINFSRLFKGKAKEDREFLAERRQSVEERKIEIVKQFA